MVTGLIKSNEIVYYPYFTSIYKRVQDQTMKHLTYYRICLADQGQKVTKEPAIAKLFASKKTLKITDRGNSNPRRCRIYKILSC